MTGPSCVSSITTIWVKLLKKCVCAQYLYTGNIKRFGVISFQNVSWKTQLENLTTMYLISVGQCFLS